MTDIMKLADVYSFSSEVSDRAALQSAIEALQSKLGDAIQSSAHWQHQFTEAQAENERLKDQIDCFVNGQNQLFEVAKILEDERDALQAQLDAISRSRWSTLDTAPKALEEQEPREQRADWLPIANALDHAVRELGRTKEANAHDWNTAVHVFEFARATTCTCCSSLMQWPAAYRCLDCKAVLCEACTPIHFGPDHSKRAAEAHEGN